VANVKCYNSERMGLKKCLDSLNGVDTILVGDGRYPDSAWGTSDPKQLEYFRNRYPPGNASTDHSREIVKSYSNAHWLDAPEQPYESETEKMNKMLEYVPDNSWVLLVDPDERLVGNIRACFPPYPCDVIAMRVTDPKGQSLYYNRLFRKKPGVSFESHHSLRLDKAVVELYLGNAPASTFLLHERKEV